MKNVKIPVAHWDCILTEREKERWRGDVGRDGNREGWRDSGRKGETERGEKTEGFLGVGVCLHNSVGLLRSPPPPYFLLLVI